MVACRTECWTTPQTQGRDQKQPRLQKPVEPRQWKRRRRCDSNNHDRYPTTSCWILVLLWVTRCKIARGFTVSRVKVIHCHPLAYGRSRHSIHLARFASREPDVSDSGAVTHAETIRLNSSSVEEIEAWIYARIQDRNEGVDPWPTDAVDTGVAFHCDCDTLDAVTWIRALSERGVSYRALWDFGRRLVRSPTVHVYQEILRGMRFAQDGALRRARASLDESPYQEACWNVWEEMQRRGVAPTSSTLVALIQAYCCSSWDVVRLWSRLVEPVLANSTANAEQLPLGPLWTDAVGEAAIYGCVSTAPPGSPNARTSRPLATTLAVHSSSISHAHASDTADQLYQALWRQQREGAPNSRQTLSEKVYLALFHVYATTKDMDKAMLLLNSILLLPTPTTSRTVSTERVWAAVLKVCVVVGDDIRTRQLLQRMSSLGCRPNVRHCTAYLKVLVNRGKLADAADFLKDMALHGVDPSPPDRHLHRRRDNRTAAQWQPITPIQNDQNDEIKWSPVGTSHNSLLVTLPDMVAVKTVLNGCAQGGNFTLARHILEQAKEGLLGQVVQQSLDEQSYNMVLASCSEPALAKELVREMRLTRRYRVGVIAPSKVTLTKAIGVCRKARDVETARFFLHMAHNDGIGTDTLMYSAAIWTAVQANNCQAAIEIFKEMQSSNCTPSIVAFNGVIAALAASGHAERAVSVFREMKQDHPSIHTDFPTFVHLTSAIRKVPVEEEQVALLWRVYALMSPRERGVSVGGRLIEALILAYGSLGHAEEALSVFESIKGPSNAECLRAILFACSFADPPEWETALALLHTSDIVEGGEGPALVEPGALCNAMLACSKANQWQESLQLFRLYGGASISIAAVNSLIASCGRAGRADIAVRILAEMEEKGIFPDGRSYRNAIMACNQAEHAYRRSLSRNEPAEDVQEWWQQAHELLQEMKQAGLVPDTPTLSSAISACEAAGRWQLALEVLQCAMDEEAEAITTNDNFEQRLNLYCFNAALAACEKGSAWVEAIEIYEKMKEQGAELRPNVVTMGSLIQALDAAGQKELAIAMYEEGIRMKFFKSPWRFTTESASGTLINAIDLHSFSAAMSRAAVRSHLESVLSTGLESPFLHEDLTIIVGKGLRSEEFPVLKEAMQNLLESEFGIAVHVDEQNSGRLVIPSDALRLFVTNRSWR